MVNVLKPRRLPSLLVAAKLDIAALIVVAAVLLAFNALLENSVLVALNSAPDTRQINSSSSQFAAVMVFAAKDNSDLVCVIANLPHMAVTTVPSLVRLQH
jgi:hypothetical protein